jgi:hypothetical protein
MVGEFDAQVVAAIRLVQAGVRWKPGKAQQHLRKRIALGHLEPESQLDDYEAVISALVHNAYSEVYVYVFDVQIYPVVVGTVGNQRWLAMFGLDGVMETAFPPTDMASYLSDSRFVKLGILQELGL